MTPTLTDDTIRAMMATWPHDDTLSRAAPELAAECLARGEQIADLQAILADPDWCNDAMAAIIATERAEVLALRRRVKELEARAIPTETLQRWCDDLGEYAAHNLINEIHAIIAQREAENE